MQIREIGYFDIPSVHDSMKTVFRELTGDIPELSMDKLFDDLFGLDKMANAIVAEENGEIVGFAFYEPKYFPYSQGRYCHISFIAVIKNFRRKGVAKLMVDHLVEHAKKMDYVGLCCDIHDVNFISRSFFKKNEFEEQRGSRIFQRKFI